MNTIFESVAKQKNNFYTVSLYHLPMREQTFIHYHDVLELGVCLEGAGQCLTADGATSFKKGDTQLILPYTPHYDVPFDNNTLWMFISIDLMHLSTVNVSFDPVYIDGLTKEIHSDIVFKSEESISDSIKEIADLIQSEKQDQDLLILKIILLLKELASDSVKDNSSLKNKSILSALRLVSSYIKEGKRPTPKAMAEVCFMSESYFRKTFTAYMGESPKSYITRMQLQKAAGMLINDSIPITHIAILCGFDDFSTFYRSFKKIYGVSPSRYRSNT